MTITGAEAVIRGLASENVKIVYGYPGGAILPVYDAMRESEIEHVLVREEQGAAHAANGYARVSGKVGVCMATSGPGATNLVTGIATAYMDSVPLVAITGQVPLSMIGTDAFQEVDIKGITHPITKHNYLVKDANDIGRVIKEAFHIASTGRPGPVLIDLPKDVLTASCEWQDLEEINLPGYKPTYYGHVNQIKNACQMINKAQKPVITAGGGIISAGAFEELAELAHKAQIPVVNTLMGLGSIAHDDPLALGMLGMHGQPAANMAITESDLLINLGARFGDRVTGDLNKFAPDAKIIHVDIDPAEIGKNVQATTPIVGDVKNILSSMLDYVEENNRTEWLQVISKWRQEFKVQHRSEEGDLTAKAVLEKINEKTGGKGIMVTDVGQHQMFAAQYYQINRPGGFLSSGGLGTMGYGLPASVGAQSAAPEELVISISGDGGFQMSMGELATIQEQKLPIKIFVFNNNCLGMVKQLQDFYCQAKYHAIHFSGNPDFGVLAQAYGIKDFTVSQEKDLDQVIEEALAFPGACLVNCLLTDQETVLPMVLNGSGLDEMITCGIGGDHEE